MNYGYSILNLELSKSYAKLEMLTIIPPLILGVHQPTEVIWDFCCDSI